MRYLLGALDGYSAGDAVDYLVMPDLEKWVLDRLATIDVAIREMTEKYDFHGIFSELHQFCNSDLSAFYFEIRKDTLYCDDKDALANASLSSQYNVSFRISK